MRIKKLSGAIVLGVFLVVFAARLLFGAVSFKFEERDMILRGTVVSLSEEFGNQLRVKVKVEEEISGSSWRRTEHKIFLAANRFPDFSYGDVISAECRYYGAKNFWEYGRLRSRGAEGKCFSRLGVAVIGKKKGDPIMEALIGLRLKMLQRIRTILPEPQAGLLAGLLVGERASMAPELESALVRTGTMHIVAISGFNVAMITSGLFAVLAWIMGRRRAFWLVLILVCAFVFMVGASASVVRAAIMGAAVLAGKILGRTGAGTRLLVLAAGIMLVFNPWLIFDYGFLLSFAATWGLGALGGKISNFLGFIPKELFVRGLLAETLAATAATLPLSILFFGNVSFVAPLANMTALLIVPAVTWLGFVFLILANLPILGDVLARFVWFLLTSVLGWIEYLGAQDFSGARLSEFGTRAAISAILAAVILIYVYKKRKRK